MVGAASPRPGRGLLGFARRALVALAIAVLASFLVRTFVIRDFFIPSASMSDTLAVGDHILVSRLTPWLVPVSRGDVVVFRDPGGWTKAGAEIGEPSAPAAPGGEDDEAGAAGPSALGRLLELVGAAEEAGTTYVVKRVIGVGGDRVACCDVRGRLSVNGVPLDEPYLRPGDDAIAASLQEFDVIVAAGSVWVMGDNRNGSRDSRAHLAETGRGTVPEEQLVGIAFARSWPPVRWGLIGAHPEVFERAGARAGSSAPLPPR